MWTLWSAYSGWKTLAVWLCLGAFAIAVSGVTNKQFCAKSLFWVFNMFDLQAYVSRTCIGDEVMRGECIDDHSVTNCREIWRRLLWTTWTLMYTKTHSCLSCLTGYPPIVDFICIFIYIFSYICFSYNFCRISVLNVMNEYGCVAVKSHLFSCLKKIYAVTPFNFLMLFWAIV